MVKVLFESPMAVAKMNAIEKDLQTLSEVL